MYTYIINFRLKDGVEGKEGSDYDTRWRLLSGLPHEKSFGVSPFNGTCYRLMKNYSLEFSEEPKATSTIIVHSPSDIINFSKCVQGACDIAKEDYISIIQVENTIAGEMIMKDIYKIEDGIAEEATELKELIRGKS